MGKKMSGRFVAGMSVEEALAACQRVNKEGIAVTLDSLGESVTTEAESRKSADIYHELLDAIHTRGLNANVSVKLSQVGMDFDPALAFHASVGSLVSFIYIHECGERNSQPLVCSHQITLCDSSPLLSED